MKHFTYEGKDYAASLIDGELSVFESGSYFKIPLADRPKLAEMAANAVGAGNVDMATNAGPRRLRKQVLRRWMDKWSKNNT